MGEKKTFWTTLPGVLTGIAALVTATGGLVATLYQVGVIGEKEVAESNMLPAPIPEAPACGSTIRALALTRFLVLNWQPVDGASTYSVEIDCFGCGQYPNKWYSQSGNPWHVKSGLGRRTLRSPKYSSKAHVKLRQAGGTSLRWRVWALDSAGRESKKSEWCQLAFYGNAQ